MDSLDHRILDQLRDNARAGYGDIGSVVGLSASAVKRRVDRLVADGVIQGFTIKVDPAVEDRGTEAWVELYCRGTVSPDELRALLDSVPEVVDAGTVTGSADAVVHMRSRTCPRSKKRSTSGSHRRSTTRAPRSCSPGWSSRVRVTSRGCPGPTSWRLGSHPRIASGPAWSRRRRRLRRELPVGHRRRRPAHPDEEAPGGAPRPVRRDRDPDGRRGHDPAVDPRPFGAVPAARTRPAGGRSTHGPEVRSTLERRGRRRTVLPGGVARGARRQRKGHSGTLRSDPTATHHERAFLPDPSPRSTSGCSSSSPVGLRRSSTASRGASSWSRTGRRSTGSRRSAGAR